MKRSNKPKILILEDNPINITKAEKAILDEFPSAQIEVCNNPRDVVAHINPRPAGSWDVVLLDRAYAGIGNFHVFDIEKFGPNRVIAISSTPSNNDAARARGVSRVAQKDYVHWNRFTEALLTHLHHMLD